MNTIFAHKNLTNILTKGQLLCSLISQMFLLAIPLLLYLLYYLYIYCIIFIFIVLPLNSFAFLTVSYLSNLVYNHVNAYMHVCMLLACELVYIHLHLQDVLTFTWLSDQLRFVRRLVYTFS